MSIRTTWLAILVLAGWAAPVHAQVTLAWKFQEGDSFFVENVVSIKGTLDSMGKIKKQESTTTTVTRCTVKKTTPQGTILEIKFEGVKVKTSEGDNAQNNKDAGKMKGSVFTVTLNPAGKIVKLEGFEEYVKKLADGNADREKVLRMGPAEEALRKSIQETFDFLPGRPVSAGDTWKQEALTPHDFGSFKVAKTYSFQGMEKGEALIAFTAAMTYVPPGEGSPFKVTKGALKAEDAKGQFRFDVDKGRLLRGQGHVLIRGSLTIEFMDEEQNYQLTLEQETAVRVLSVNPLKER